MSTRRTLIVVTAAAAAFAVTSGLLLRPPSAGAEPTTPFEALRQRLRTFTTLRFGASYLSPRAVVAVRGDGTPRTRCSPRAFRADCPMGGLFTVVADGRVSWDRLISVNVGRVLFEPPGIYRYEVGRAAAPPDVPAVFAPMFQSLFVVLRAGFGTLPATAGSEASFGLDSIELTPQAEWYRIQGDFPPFGQSEWFFGYGNLHLGNIIIRNAEGEHSILLDPMLFDFELEPLWFAHDLVKLQLPVYDPDGDWAADTGMGLPDGRAKVIE